MSKYFEKNTGYFNNPTAGETESEEAENGSTESSKSYNKDQKVSVEHKNYTLRKPYSKVIGYVKKQD